MSEIKWVHREFDLGDKVRVLKLREQVFGEPDYDETRWNWQYLTNPHGKGIIDLAVDKDDKEKLAGHYAVIEQMFINNGIEVKLAQSLDTFTSADYRRQGIFVELANKTYERAQRDGVAAIFGFPNGNSYPGFVKKLEFDSPFGFGVYKLPLTLGYYLKKIFKKDNFLTNISLVGKRPTQTDCVLVDKLCDNFDKVFERVESHKLYIKRDEAYFQWRYFKCPDRQYQIYECTDSEVFGYFVLNVDKSSGFCHLVDLVVKDPAKTSDMIAHAINKARETKMSCLSVFLNEGNYLGGLLKDSGFKFTDKSESSRFILRGLSSEGLSTKASDWYITAGDTDFY